MKYKRKDFTINTIEYANKLFYLIFYKSYCMAVRITEEMANEAIDNIENDVYIVERLNKIDVLDSMKDL